MSNPREPSEAKEQYSRPRPLENGGPGSEAQVRDSDALDDEERDIEALKRLAEREGMPYQTLLGSIVHKYVNGTLVDPNEARKMLAKA